MDESWEETRLSNQNSTPECVYIHLINLLKAISLKLSGELAWFCLEVFGDERDSKFLNHIAILFLSPVVINPMIHFMSAWQHLGLFQAMA